MQCTPLEEMPTSLHCPGRGGREERWGGRGGWAWYYLLSTTPGVSCSTTCETPSVKAPNIGLEVVLVLGDTADTCTGEGPHLTMEGIHTAAYRTYEDKTVIKDLLS